MTLPDNLLAYGDCTELLSQAVEDPRGVRLRVEDYDKAMHERSRIHYCRTLHRRESTLIYEPGDPMYGKSQYDIITIRIKNINGEFYLYLERNDKIKGAVEKLSEITDVEFVEIPAVESPKEQIKIEVQPQRLLIHRRV